MQLRQVMTPQSRLSTVLPEASLRDAARKMKEADTGFLPVVERSDPTRLRGVITDRDITVRAVAEGLDPDSSKVADCMTRETACVSPDMELKEAAKEMSRRQIHRLCVEEGGKLIGVLSLGDLAVTEPDAAEEALGGISHGAKAERRD